MKSARRTLPKTHQNPLETLETLAPNSIPIVPCNNPTFPGRPKKTAKSACHNQTLHHPTISVDQVSRQGSGAMPEISISWQGQQKMKAEVCLYEDTTHDHDDENENDIK